MTRENSEKKSTKQAEMVTDFGERKVNTQNFSKTVVLPKTALENCQPGEEVTSVDVQLVQTIDEKFIKLIPICGISKKKKTEESDSEGEAGATGPAGPQGESQNGK